MPNLCLVTPKYVSRTTYSQSNPVALWTSTSLSFFMQKGPGAGAWDLNEDSHSWKARIAFLQAGFTILPCAFQPVSSRQRSPRFPPSALEDLGWVGPHGWWRGVGISPSSSVRPLLEQEAANVESRCVSGGNWVCRRQGKDAQNRLREQHLSRQSKMHAPNKMPLQQRQAHQPTSSPTSSADLS